MNSHTYRCGDQDNIQGQETFDHIGGLRKQIATLNQMVIKPLMYPRLLKGLPKGILFHGEPGTGKTLLARALANEIRELGRPVHFLEVKGVDCLSMWLGESEQRIRDIFVKAKLKQPTVLFFDEFDGLAPSRCSRQDHVYSSIVSTLLGQMDGIDNRGEVVVIGATNRIDAIDGALRRPGRFDRELHFPLPGFEERYEILKIHTRGFGNQIPDNFIRQIADRTRGACGADLKALCTEASLAAIQRTYPEIFESPKRQRVDRNAISVQCCDFKKAVETLVFSSNREIPPPSRPLEAYLKPLLMQVVKDFEVSLREYFPQGFRKNSARTGQELHKEYRVLLSGPPDSGQTSYIAPALLNTIACSIFSLTLTILYPEEAIVQIFKDAKKCAPSVIYLPDICNFWEQANDSCRCLFESSLRHLEVSCNILVFATAQKKYEDVPDELKQMFVSNRHRVLQVPTPTDEERTRFFHQLFEKAMRPPQKQTDDSEAGVSQPSLAYRLRGRDVEAIDPGTSKNLQKPSESSRENESSCKSSCRPARQSRSLASVVIPVTSPHEGARQEKEAKKVKLNEIELMKVLKTCVNLTARQSTENIVYLFHSLSNRCHTYEQCLNREQLDKDLNQEVMNFKNCL